MTDDPTTPSGREARSLGPAIPTTSAADCPVDLSLHINHVGAPMDWVAQHGPGYCDSPLLCPVCRTSEVFIRTGGTKNDCYLPDFPQRGSAYIRTTDGAVWDDDKQARGVGMHIPMHCSAGHRFLLNIAHNATDPNGEEPCHLSVVLDESLYPTGVENELSDYDAAAAASAPTGREE